MKIKAYISIATFLAAGAAFANAASWEDGREFTTSSYTADFSTSEAGASVILLLDVNAFSGLFSSALSSSRPVFVSMTDASGHIAGLEAHESSRITGATGVSAGSTYSNLYSFRGGDGDSVSSITWTNVVSAALTMAIDNSTGTAWALTVLYNDGTYFEKYATCTSIKWSSGGDYSSFSIDTSVVQKAYAFDGYITGSDAYALNRLAIPEPSAFGLLAGLGALALAGTRRRRK